MSESGSPEKKSSVAASHEVEAAQENLRVIRSLMEKATVYRAISSPVALAGGVLAIGISAWMRSTLRDSPSTVTPQFFLGLWLGAMALVALLNSWLIARQARARAEPFVSPGMRTALNAFLPPFLAGGVIGTAFVFYEQDLLMCAVVWLTFYGLALLATGNFAPLSIRRLGLGFFAIGLFAFVMVMRQKPSSINDANTLAATLMGAGFGILHLAYGVSVLFHSRQSEQ